MRGLNATVNLAANASTQISEKIELAEFQDAAAAIVLGCAAMADLAAPLRGAKSISIFRVLWATMERLQANNARTWSAGRSRFDHADTIGVSWDIRCIGQRDAGRRGAT